MDFESINLESAYFSEQEQQDHLKQNRSCDFRSKINFLNSHNGIRRGKMHLLMAPTGVGKSTLIRTLVRDLLFNNGGLRLFIWLTEESASELKEQLAFGMPSNKVLDNAVIFSEFDNKHMDIDQLGEFYEKLVTEHKPDVLLLDNITTSKMYREMTTTRQAEVTTRIKNLTDSSGTATFLIAHTGANVQDNQNRLIDENDIRGSKYITTITEFLYILQPLRVGERLFQFIRIKKHRGQELKHSLFYLVYNKHLKAFDNDMERSFEEFKEIFKLRNQLK